MEESPTASFIIFIVTLGLIGVILYYFIGYFIAKKKIEDVLRPPPPPSSVPPAQESKSIVGSESIGRKDSNSSLDIFAKASDTFNDILADPRLSKLYDPSKSDLYVPVDSQLRSGNIPIDKMYTLMMLLNEAVTSIKKNINTLSEATFYQQSAETIMIRYPFYRPIMAFCSFVARNSDITGQTIDDALVRLYDSKNSPYLYEDLQGIKYYVILEFEEAFIFFDRNRKYVETFLGINK